MTLDQYKELKQKTILYELMLLELLGLEDFNNKLSKLAENNSTILIEGQKTEEGICSVINIDGLTSYTVNNKDLLSKIKNIILLYTRAEEEALKKRINNI